MGETSATIQTPYRPAMSTLPVTNGKSRNAPRSDMASSEVRRKSDRKYQRDRARFLEYKKRKREEQNSSSKSNTPKTQPSSTSHDANFPRQKSTTGHDHSKTGSHKKVAKDTKAHGINSNKPSILKSSTRHQNSSSPSPVNYDVDFIGLPDSEGTSINQSCFRCGSDIPVYQDIPQSDCVLSADLFFSMASPFAAECLELCAECEGDIGPRSELAELELLGVEFGHRGEGAEPEKPESSAVDLSRDVPVNREHRVPPDSPDSALEFQQWDHIDPWHYPLTHIPQSIPSLEYETYMDVDDYRRRWDDDFGWYIDSSTTANFDGVTKDWEHLATIANYYED